MQHPISHLRQGMWLVSLLAAALPACKQAEEPVKRPNIVLIVADDLGTDDLGIYGNSKISTPNLDYLANNGMRFTNAYCTSASCSASRSVILTGLYNHANGQYGHAHSFHHFQTFDTIISLPKVLNEAGYVTGRVGKFHIAPESVYPFDKIIPGGARNAVEMAEQSKAFIQSAESPFFLYFCTDDPHRSDVFAEEIPTRPDRFGNRPEGYTGVIDRTFGPDDVLVPDYLPDNLATRYELAQYYQAVDRMDQGFGRLFEILKESGKWENTIIVFMSDNGIAFPGAKTNLYDPGMRIPLVFYYPPEIQKASVSDAMVNWTYITPTLLDMAGLLSTNNTLADTPNKTSLQNGDATKARTRFHGRSFRSVFSDNPEVFDEIFASHTFHEITMYYPMRVVQDRQYKLIWNIASGLDYPHATDLWASSTWQSVAANEENLLGKRTIRDYTRRPPFELYDMVNDPHEANNLAFRPEYTSTLNHYIQKIKEFQTATSDPWICKWEHE